MFIYKYTHIIQYIVIYNNFNIGSSMACRLEYLSYQHLHYFLQAAKMGPCLHQMLKKSEKTSLFTAKLKTAREEKKPCPSLPSAFREIVGGISLPSSFSTEKLRKQTNQQFPK